MLLLVHENGAVLAGVGEVHPDGPACDSHSSLKSFTQRHAGPCVLDYLRVDAEHNSIEKTVSQRRISANAQDQVETSAPRLTAAA